MAAAVTYGVCMGGALQMQCGSGNVLVRSVLLLIYFVPVSALLAVASRESLRFSGKFTDYGFRDEPTDQMCHQAFANVLCPFCRTAGAAGTAYAVI